MAMVIRDGSDFDPQIEQEAASLYRHLVERGLVTGRSIRGVTAACVYIAAKRQKIPRKMSDMRRGLRHDFRSR